MTAAPTLFRVRFAFVCDCCDLGYRAGRLAGHNPDGRLECATCLVGADPDTDAPASQEDRTPCQDTPEPAPALFDFPEKPATPDENRSAP